MWNTLRTFVLMAALTALFGGAGYALGGPDGMALALIFACVTNLFAWWNADKIVLDLYDARPVPSGWLTEIVRILAAEAGIPAPRVYVIETAQPNAFATGRDPKHAAVVVTRGLLDLLDGNELRCVLGHELTHIRHGDTLTMTIAASFAGALSTLANFAMLFGAAGSRRRGNPVSILLLMLFAPLMAMLGQLAISRAREYAADRGGAKLTGQPLVLARALEKLDAAARRIPNDAADRNPGTAHLFIVNPLSGLGFLATLFATHPPTAARVQALHRLVERELSNEITGTVL